MLTSRRPGHLAQCLFYVLMLAVLWLWFNARGTQGENRLLATFPAWPKDISSVRPFTQGVESWLSDRIGFREYWLMPPRMLDVYAFGLSPSPMVTLGDDGTAYLQRHSPNDPPHKAILGALGLNGPWEEQEQGHYATQARLEDWAAKASLPVLYLAVPTSPLFRFEQLPQALRQSLKPRLDNPPLHAAVRRFQADFPHAAARFLYPLETGRDVAQTWPVYPQKNFHWTLSPFTTRVSEDIVQALGWPLHRPIKDGDFEPCTTSSDIKYLLGIPFYNWDDACHTPVFYKDSPLSSPALPQGVTPLLSQAKGASKAVRHHKNASIPAGRLLVVGDSFTPTLCLPLARNVREVLCVEYGEAIRSGVDTRALLQTLRENYAPDALVIVSHDGFAFDPGANMPGMEAFTPAK